MKKIISVCMLLMVIMCLNACITESQVTTNMEKPVSIATEFPTESNEICESKGYYSVSEQVNMDVGIIEKDEVVYVCDSTGVWKKTKDSNEKEYLTKNSAMCIATDGKTLLYVHQVGETVVANFTKINSEIHAINIDGTDDKVLVECTSSAQPLVIYENSLYYVDYYLHETFARYLFELDIPTGNKNMVSEDVGFPKVYKNDIYYTEVGFLENTQDCENKVYSVEKKELISNTEFEFDEVGDFSFSDWVVRQEVDTDEFYYKNRSQKLDLKEWDVEKYNPLFYYDNILYYVHYDSSWNATVDMKKYK